MAQSTFMRFAPVFLGVAAASTLLAPLSAQAASASYGTGYVKFLDIKLTRNTFDLFNIAATPASKGNTASGSLSPGGVSSFPNPDNGGPDLTPGGPSTTSGSVALTAGVSFSNANADITIPPRVMGMTSASSDADTTFSLTRPIAESTSNSANNQTNLVFTANAGDVIALTGFIDAFLESTVTGYVAGGPAAISQVQFNTSYTISKTGAFCAIPGTMGCFAGPAFQAGVAVINENTTRTFSTGGPVALPAALLSYVIPMSGEYTIVFNSNITSQGTHGAMTTVPEPSAVLGLAGVALVGVLARKRRLG